MSEWWKDPVLFGKMIVEHGSPTRAARALGGISERQARRLANASSASPSASTPTARVTPRILYLDIETSPNIADVWGIWQQNIGLPQLRESQRVIGFGAKWAGDRGVMWSSEYHDGRAQMLAEVHRMLDAADVVVTYNGDKFDIKHLNAEFVVEGIPPYSPVQSIDLYKVVKKQFKWPSNKLAYVADRLIGDTKIVNGGHMLWRQCLDDDVDPVVKRKAWDLMARYCKQDVALLEPLHEKLKPWLPQSMTFSVFNGNAMCCAKCSSVDLERRGYAYTPTRAYQQFRCRDCGGWTRGLTKEFAASLR